MQVLPEQTSVIKLNIPKVRMCARARARTHTHPHTHTHTHPFASNKISLLVLIRQFLSLIYRVFEVMLL